jgi:hypothetical protein
LGPWKSKDIRRAVKGSVGTMDKLGYKKSRKSLFGTMEKLGYKKEQLE